MSYTVHAIGGNPLVYGQIRDENDLFDNRAAFQINQLNQDDN
jgi:hypothetical protein